MRGDPFLSVKENQGRSAEALLRRLGLLFGEKQPTDARPCIEDWLTAFLGQRKSPTEDSQVGNVSTKVNCLGVFLGGKIM